MSHFRRYSSSLRNNHQRNSCQNFTLSFANPTASSSHYQDNIRTIFDIFSCYFQIKILSSAINFSQEDPITSPLVIRNVISINEYGIILFSQNRIFYFFYENQEVYSVIRINRFPQLSQQFRNLYRLTNFYRLCQQSLLLLIYRQLS